MGNQRIPEWDEAQIDFLCNLGRLSRDEALEIMRRDDLEQLQLIVASKLYATTPMMTSGDAAAKVGLRNRGLLLQYLDENRIAPAPVETAADERSTEILKARMEQRLKRWHS